MLPTLRLTGYPRGKQTDKPLFKGAKLHLKSDLFWNVANLAFDRVSRQQTDRQTPFQRCKVISKIRFVLICCQPCIWQGIPAPDRPLFKDAKLYLKSDLFWNVANLAFDRVSRRRANQKKRWKKSTICSEISPNTRQKYSRKLLMVSNVL